MRKCRFQKTIYLVRKILSIGVTLTAPLFLKLASNYATIERGYSDALGSEILIPIIILLLGYLIYPKYDDTEDGIIISIKDELGQVHNIKITERS